MIIKLAKSCRFAPLWAHVRLEWFRWQRPYHGPHVLTRDANGQLRRNASGAWDPVILPWAFWPPISFKIVKLGVHPPTTGYGLCIYTRWGWCRQDLTFDRRGLEDPPVVRRGLSVRVGKRLIRLGHRLGARSLC